ncbi:hypothetical protein ACJQWK_05462 [Exserohilum turcicum]|uniref:MT-A70-domain-containing protein n=1 Tax=Exserohilum turcicum (strain 28A) TaxID=671987 RepID=R0JWB9_EXST2|nr:uncharacterized protein SETTUDRAFT_181133 [Exserohilum turcica Et28A]EOA81794.1 hypothetical protein SETTUDRAFT_181133 [Exserohilum turcica Et28A]
MAAPSPILYQNADADITLMDIAASIVAAQGDRSDTLLSTRPLEAPIKLNHASHARPKPPRAGPAAARSHGISRSQQKTSTSPVGPREDAMDPSRHKLPSRDLDDRQYKALVQHALAQIRPHVSGPWCMPRKLMTQPPRCGQEETADLHGRPTEKELESSMREWASWNQARGDDTAFHLQQMMASLGVGAASGAAEAAAVTHGWLVSYRHAHETHDDDDDDDNNNNNNNNSTPGSSTQDTQTEPWTCAFHNPHNHSLRADIVQNTRPRQDYRFTIPPRATLFLSDSTASDAFRRSFRQLTDEHALPRHFDLVLLDPPWPNRSAKRKGAYEQVGGMPYLRKMLLSMDIDTYLEQNALVGVWITNKASLRDHVLGPGGLFETWNVGLMEEWIWVKTTTKGEPMLDIDSAMRKPYEILLLGRAAPNSWTSMVHAPTVKTRVIAAVPDIHSRKPCLKALLEPYLVDATDYSALEVFSRYLVSGWTSWGNEVLKYNWEGYWEPGPSAGPEC